MTSVFQDDDIRLELLSMAVYDAAWLKSSFGRVTQDDFKPVPGGSSDRKTTMSWVVAGLALEFYRKHKQPVANLLKKELRTYAHDAGTSKEKLDEYLKFADRLKAKYNPERSQILSDEVSGYKQVRERQTVLRELVELERAGQLTHEKFVSLTKTLSKVESQAPGVLASEVKPKRVDWLWTFRIPLGFITTFDGDPGLGKSAFSLLIAANVSRGKPLPNGTEACLGGVVVLSAEDDAEHVIQPRLKVLGADLKRIRVVPYTSERAEDSISSLLDIALLERAVLSVDAKLVILDPLSSYLPERSDSHNDKSVRRALAPLAAMAQRFGVAVVLIRHLPKATPTKAIHAGIGSIGIVASARSGFIIAKDPDDEEQCVLAHVKSNLAPMMPSLTFRKETVQTDIGEIVRIKFVGQSDYSAADLLKPNDKETITDQAAAYLRSALTGGVPVPVEVLTRSGYSLAALKKAKKKLGVLSEKEAFETGWAWRLPDDSED